MFRQGLRRCATQAGAITSASTMLRSRAAMPIACQPTIMLRSIAPSNKFISISRMYSTEEAAVSAEPEVADSASSDTMEFRELSKLGVHPALVQIITEKMRYDTMTPVQAKTITPALKGTDIVAQAKTGTGKTIAFLLPLIQRMLNEDPTLVKRGAARRARPNDIRGIVLSPTRELAMQIAEEATKLTYGTGLVVQCAVGGTDKRSMLRQTQREGCHILVATPGRLNDLLSDPSSGIDAPDLAALVLDEADRMLDTGFEQELHSIIGMLPKPENKVRQTMLVSATIPDEVIRLARTMVRPDDFEFVQTIPENESLTHDKVPQHVVPVATWSNVLPTLYELIDTEAEKAAKDPSSRPFKAIVYFNTTALVQLTGEMAYQRRRQGAQKISTWAIHSKLSQMARTRAAESFKRSRTGVMLSTNVTARGMDFPDVTHVIQIDCPPDRESYIHRLGRTGRQNKEGDGWLIVPQHTIGDTKHMLRGLPLKQEAELSSPSVDVSRVDELPKHFAEVKDLVSVVPAEVRNSFYTSLFGGTKAKRTLSQELKEVFEKAWGMETPPVGSSWAQKLGIPTAYLNIRSSFGGHRDDGFGRNDDGFGDSAPVSDDPFENMGRNVRRDDFGGGGGRSGGGRGFGGGGGGRRGGGYGDRDFTRDRRSGGNASWNQRGRSRGRY